MPDETFSLGVDFGTNTVRALVVRTEDGGEVGTGVAAYQHGEQGVLLDPVDPNLARQHPQDYFDGFNAAVKRALADAGVDGDRIVGIGLDTTGSTPIPVDSHMVPLACHAEFDDNLNAMAWLWKDHTAHAEAAEITELASEKHPEYLAKCGGVYSSEWFWAKLLRCARVAPDVFDLATSWVELQDLVPAWLTGCNNPSMAKRGVCAAGHKAMWSREWGGLPEAKFLSKLDPRLADLRSRLYTDTQTADQLVGGLTYERAAACGLAAGTPVATGAFDAHLGAVGSGVKPRTMVKIMGTSTCDILVAQGKVPDIPGVCGIVPGSVLPGMVGIEAGQSAVGDLFAWCVNKLGSASHESVEKDAIALRPGESGLVALDWNNGNRTVLVDPLLTGLVVGQTLHTNQAEIYRALVEATAFGARKIIERIASYGVAVDEIIVCGGIADKSPGTLQVYADVCARPIKTSRSSQTCALGAAMCGAVVGGRHPDLESAAAAMTGCKDLVFVPDAKAVHVYDRLYRIYSQLHDAFGTPGLNPDLSPLMKQLIALRTEARSV